MILVSACLLGYHTKYDGGTNSTPLLMQYISCEKFIPFCPEKLGGFPIPHPASEIINGSGQDVLAGKASVRHADGTDVTIKFMQGAKKTAELAQQHHITAAIVKQRSPSCGSTAIYDGTFAHHVRAGSGVATTALIKMGIPVYSEEDLTPELLTRLLAADEG